MATADIAERRVSEYDSALRQNDAMEEDCAGCEEGLLLGLEAFRWLVRSKELAASGLASGYPEAHAACQRTETLYRLWLRNAELTINWVQKHVANQTDVRYLPEFLAFQKEALAFLATLEHDELHAGVTLTPANADALQDILNRT